MSSVEGMAGRVALVHPHSWPRTRRGGERYLHDLGSWLQRHGQETVIVTGREPGEPVDDVDGVPVHRTWRLPPSRLAGRMVGARLAAATLRAPLRALRPRVVHGLMPGAAIGATRLGLPTIYTSLGAPNGEFARRQPRQWAPIHRAATQADVVTAVGRAAATALAELTGREVLALPPGLRTERLRPDLAPRTGPPRVLFASAVDAPNKHFATLVAAVDRVTGEHPDIRLTVIGPGDLRPALAAAGRAGQRVAGRIERPMVASGEVGSWFAAATVTVLASVGEAFGLVLAESLACGTPVIASDRGGPGEIVAGRDGDIGFRVPPGDADGLAQALEAAIERAAEPDVPARCVAHARQWNWDVVGPRHLEVYVGLGDTGLAETRV